MPIIKRVSFGKETAMKKVEESSIAIGIALGLIFGMLLDSLALGLCIGVALGSAGVFASKKSKKSKK